jgi:phosphoribosylglycinamide formyltransferase-1
VKNIVLFASGSGTNVQNIAEFFNKDNSGKVVAVFCNNPKAFVIQRCEKLGIPCIIFNKDDFYNSERIIELTQAFEADIVVLAGFLWLVPENLIEAYPKRIINIHPALLPNFGGKGMYGMYVHEAVIQSNKRVSGITIHLVTKEYDKGKKLFQAKTKITKDDTAESLANKIHELEQKHFPMVIKEYIEDLS